MQSTENVSRYILMIDSMLKSWGPLFAFMFVTVFGAVVFLYKEYWPIRKKQLLGEYELAMSRETLLHTLIKTSQDRADKLIKDNYDALAELTNVFQANMEKLFTQGLTNAGKLDAILDALDSKK